MIVNEADRLVTEFRSPDGHLEVMHMDGLPWYQARRPLRWHRCHGKTEVWMDYVYLTQRCPCGAIRNPPGQWRNRNSRSL